MLESVSNWFKQISQIGKSCTSTEYACTSTDKASLISVQVFGFHWRLRMKLPNVPRF